LTVSFRFSSKCDAAIAMQGDPIGPHHEVSSVLIVLLLLFMAH
jgi:hypothetical protein